MKKTIAILLAAILLLSLLSACAPKETVQTAEPAQDTSAGTPEPEKPPEKEPEPEPEKEPEPEPEPDEEVDEENAQADAALEEARALLAGTEALVPGAQAVLTERFAQRVFDEDKDLSSHPGLLHADDVTGPFLQLVRDDGSIYVPDVTGDDKPDPAFPEDAHLESEDAARIGAEYLSLLLTPDKAERPDGVFALLEYTGYGTAGEYNNGNFTLYYHRTRISFYDLSSGELIAWMNTTESRGGPFLLKMSDYASDGQHPIIKAANGTIWSDTVWSKALDELFYDENGYQVVGTRLLSVPMDVDPIVVPKGVTQIGDYVGMGHKARTLILPEGLVRIGYAAFSNSAIETVEFPDSVRYVDVYAFMDTPWWAAHEDEDYVIVGDGVLLYARAEGDEIVLPEEVHFVMPDSLDGLYCRKLTIPASVVQLCGRVDWSPLEGSSVLETLLLYGGLQKDPDTGADIVVSRWCQALKTLYIDCPMDKLPEYWFKIHESYTDKLTVYCEQDTGSDVVHWAAKNGVQCKPLDEYQP